MFPVLLQCRWLLEEVLERMWPLRDPLAGHVQSEAPHLLPCPWSVRSARWSRTRRHFQGRVLKTAVCPGDHLGGRHDWTQLRPLLRVNTSYSCGWVQRSPYLGGLSYVSSLLIWWHKLCMLPYVSGNLLNLPPTHLEWSASFLDFPLPSEYGTSLQTNSRWGRSTPTLRSRPLDTHIHSRREPSRSGGLPTLLVP